MIRAPWSVHIDRSVTGAPTFHGKCIYDGQQIVEEVASAIATSMQYVWGQYIDELIQLNAVEAAGPNSLTGIYYLLSDLLYRSAALTDTSGTPQIVETYDTDAYGETLLFSAAGTGGNWFADNATQAAYSACRYVFTGREYDPESGNYFYRARYYGPALGRFAARDAAALSLGLYEYADSAPCLLLDPFGLAPSTAPAAAPAPAPKLAPNAGIGYVLQQLTAEENIFRNCWIYRAAGIDKMFAAITTAAMTKGTVIKVSNGTVARFNRGNFEIDPKGADPSTMTHESVHAFNYDRGNHQGGSDAAIKADEGMAYAVQDSLDVARLLCGKGFTGCVDCNAAQRLWDSTFRAFRTLTGAGGKPGAQSGTNAVADTLNNTHFWDVNAKLNLRFSSSALLPQFQRALAAMGLNCNIVNPPASPADKSGQPDPFG